jgi:hypothetical protein
MNLLTQALRKQVAVPNAREAAYNKQKFTKSGKDYQRHVTRIIDDYVNIAVRSQPETSPPAESKSG